MTHCQEETPGKEADLEPTQVLAPTAVVTVPIEIKGKKLNEWKYRHYQEVNRIIIKYTYEMEGLELENTIWKTPQDDLSSRTEATGEGSRTGHGRAQEGEGKETSGSQDLGPV